MQEKPSQAELANSLCCSNTSTTKVHRIQHRALSVRVRCVTVPLFQGPLDRGGRPLITKRLGMGGPGLAGGAADPEPWGRKMNPKRAHDPLLL